MRRRPFRRGLVLAVAVLGTTAVSCSGAEGPASRQASAPTEPTTAPAPTTAAATTAPSATATTERTGATTQDSSRPGTAAGATGDWVADEVTRLYLAAFGRRPDPAGLRHWVDQRSTRTAADVAEDLVRSPEFPLAQERDEARFVDGLFRALFGRPADPVADASWVDGLRRGVLTRGAVLASLADAPEYVARTSTVPPAGPEHDPARRRPPVEVTDPRLFILGDSVLLGLATQFTGAAERVLGPLGWQVTLDTEVSRAYERGLAILAARRQDLGQVVVVQLANNYGRDPRPWAAQVEEIQRLLRPLPCVVWLTVAEFRPDRREVNDVLRAAAARHPSMVLGDWAALVAADPGLTARDGLHLSSRGGTAMAELIAGLVGRPGQPACGGTAAPRAAPTG